MKGIKFTFLLMIIGLLCFSQPVITYSAMPTVGVTGTVLVSSTVPSPGSAGAGVTWNFSTPTFTQVGVVSVVNCSSTPFYSSFPMANSCMALTSTVVPSTYQYNENQPGYSQIYGDDITATSGSTLTPDPKWVFQFPFNYTNSFTDTYQCTTCSPSSVTRTYDGYGTLIVNGKTYYNVVRIKSVFGGGSTAYYYYNTNPIFPIFQINSSSSTSLLIEMAPTGINENSLVLNMVNIFPTVSSSNITIDNKNPFNIDVSIYSVTGDNILTKHSVNGNSSDVLNLSTLSKGIYFIDISNQENINQRKIQKIIIQ